MPRRLSNRLGVRRHLAPAGALLLMPLAVALVPHPATAQSGTGSWFRVPSAAPRAPGPQQVMIKAAILETRLEDLNELGVDLGVQVGGFQVASRPALVQASVGKTFPEGDGLSVLGLGVDLQVDLIPSVLDAVAEAGTARLLTTPRIVPYGDIGVGVTRYAYDLPDGSDSQVETSVVVGAGARIVLGGLSQEPRRRLPILGDIAILGRLFDGEARPVLRTQLLIFITPRLIRSP